MRFGAAQGLLAATAAAARRRRRGRLRQAADEAGSSPAASIPQARHRRVRRGFGLGPIAARSPSAEVPLRRDGGRGALSDPSVSLSAGDVARLASARSCRLYSSRSAGSTSRVGSLAARDSRPGRVRSSAGETRLGLTGSFALTFARPLGLGGGPDPFGLDSGSGAAFGKGRSAASAGPGSRGSRATLGLGRSAHARRSRGRSRGPRSRSRSPLLGNGSRPVRPRRRGARRGPRKLRAPRTRVELGLGAGFQVRIRLRGVEKLGLKERPASGSVVGLGEPRSPPGPRPPRRGMRDVGRSRGSAGWREASRQLRRGTAARERTLLDLELGTGSRRRRRGSESAHAASGSGAGRGRTARRAG